MMKFLKSSSFGIINDVSPEQTEGLSVQIFKVNTECNSCRNYGKINSLFFTDCRGLTNYRLELFVFNACYFRFYTLYFF